ncbi:putative ferlin [Gregarina niphandrodes]|uniref:Ferlin n=1 Tax=Gregarina niphandrodes TaxID=110365 RepID=A0A023B729_GRENI|nr:putative ferlin [Gregarina niphandrodes]EZG66938.1 putative ferlin [Gregarina niphandrodes]|eukprot:XP_011130416.1 putative ferlin [Gregarina niphandrodes]
MDAYNVSFTIKDVNNMVSPDGGVINPLVVVRCAGQEYRTEIKYEKLGLVNFDEAHSWPNLVMPQQSFDQAVIEFELQSANAFWANTTIGLAAIQLRSVKNRGNHTLSGYVPLIGINESKTTGNLNLTLSVLGPGDVLRVEEENQ